MDLGPALAEHREVVSEVAMESPKDCDGVCGLTCYDGANFSSSSSYDGGGEPLCLTPPVMLQILHQVLQQSAPSHLDLSQHPCWLS